MDYHTLVMGTVFALISILYIIIAKICSKGSKNLPPGSSPLPIIGNLHLLGEKPHVSLANLAEIYGPIMSLKLGQLTTVFISSSAMAKQVLQKQDLDFSTRFIPDALQHHNYSKFSMPWLPVCPQWRTLRRILNTNLLCSSRLDANQHIRSQKVKELLAYCDKCSQEAEAVDVRQIVFKTNLNLFSYTLFSKDLVDLFPDSKRLEEKQTDHSERNDVLEMFLNHSAENPEEINQNYIKSMFLDLFIGGIDSATSTLEWAMTEILRHPEIMKEVQTELAQVVGNGKPVEESNISKLPYLLSIVKETLRMHPPAPFLIPRRVDQDVQLCEYIIPKGSQVLVNVWKIGRDSTFWEDPLVFKPERFRRSELDMRGKDFELLPFGAGRRMCPGLPLALRLVPIMLGSMLNSFNWKLEGSTEPMNLYMEEKFGVILAKAHPLRVIPFPI
ncbi:unnamed protein product [Withania somnifera]